MSWGLTGSFAPCGGATTRQGVWVAQLEVCRLNLCDQRLAHALAVAGLHAIRGQVVDFSDSAEMLALAELAYIDETPRDDQAVAAQESRILNDLNGDTSYGFKQLDAKNWSAILVGLSSLLGQGSNMDRPISYPPDIATVPTPQAVAPASRGA